MLYLTHALPPTSTRHALKCTFIKPDLDSLILGKHSAIEVYGIEPDGLKLLHHYPVFGVIEHINSYKKLNDLTATLLVLTSDLNLFTLRFCPQSATVITVASISLHQIGARPADHIQTSIVDPHGRCVILHALNGILHVIPLLPGCVPKSKHLDPTLSKRKKANISPGLSSQPTKSLHPNYNDPDGEVYRSFQLRLNEVNVHALNFATLPSTYPPTLLIIYSNHLGDRVLRSRKIDLSAANCDLDFIQSYSCRDPVAGMIIPISITNNVHEDPASENVGAILVGEESAELVRFPAPQTSLANGKGKAKATGLTVSQRKQPADQSMVAVSTTKLPLGSYTCFCKIDQRPYTWLLGDLYGNLVILSLELSPNKSKPSLNYRPIGHVPSPEALVYIPRQFVFLASHYGDSQLLKLSSAIFSTGSALPPTPDVINTFSNLAPISDFCVTQDRKSLVDQIVTCSGAYRDGSLRVIKHGVGFRDSSCLELNSVQRLWALKSSPQPSSFEDFDDIMIISCADCTRLVALNQDGTLEEVDQFNGFRTDIPTILSGNVMDHTLPNCRYPIQITPSQVIAGKELYWEPGDGKSVTNADIGVTMCVVSLKRQVHALRLKNGLFVTEGVCDFLNDVSSLAIDPKENFVAVGQWVTNSVEIVSIPTQSRICQVNTGSNFMVNSLLITNFDPREPGQYRLLIGMGDGRMMTMGLDSHGMILEEFSPKTTSLGIRPIEFYWMKNEQGTFVWANSDQPSIISQSKNNGRLTFTPVTVPGEWTICATSLNTRYFQNCIVLAFMNEVRIGSLNRNVKMNVVKVALGAEQPRRIAYSKDMRAYGVVCVKVELDQESGVLHRIGSFKIFDDETFQLLFDFKFSAFEQGSSIAVIKLGTAMMEHFVIGTGWIKSCETEAKTGRILAFRDMNLNSSEAALTQRNFRLTNIGKLSGSVGGLGALPNGMFIASANAFVHAFAIKEGMEVSQEGAESTRGEPRENEADEPDGTLKILDTWGGGFVSQTVVTLGTKILVGDLYKSVILLEFDLDHLELNVKARDFSAMSVRPIGTISDREFIAADSEFNLFTLLHRRISQTASDSGEKTDQVGPQNNSSIDYSEDGSDDDNNLIDSEVNIHTGGLNHFTDDDNLLQVGAFNLGENVNRFRTGSLASHIESNLISKSKLLFVTSTGGVGSIVKLNSKQMTKKLAKFQSELGKVCRSVGNLDHTTYRAFKTKSRQVQSRGFLDGNFLESCLELRVDERRQLYEKILNLEKSIQDLGSTEGEPGEEVGHDVNLKAIDSELNIISPSTEFDLLLDYLEDLSRLH